MAITGMNRSQFHEMYSQDKKIVAPPKREKTPGVTGLAVKKESLDIYKKK